MKHITRGIALAALIAVGAVAQTQKIDSIICKQTTVIKSVWYIPFLEPVRVDTITWIDSTVYYRGGR